MTQIATGVFKKLVAKKQSALGTIATTASGQLYRRVTSTLDKKKATYTSKEIRPSMQRSDMRHGVVSVDGAINGELSVGTYQDFMASVVRQLFQTAATSGALITVAAAVTTGASGTFTRSAGSFLTDGFKVGMVVRWTGWATTGVPNNSHNFLITNLTALVMTGVMLDGVAVGAKIAGDSVTCLEVGKHNFIPQSAHTRDYWTIEHNFSDIVQSEVFTDCMFTGMSVKLPATGMATIDFPVMGLNMTPGTAQYFVDASLLGASSGANLAAVNGAVYVAGVAVGLITGIDFTINGNVTGSGGVVGSNAGPDLFPGAFDVNGTLTVLFTDATMRDYFLNETEVSIIAVFTTGNTAAADFMAFTFPRAKMGGANKDDGEKGLTMTMTFVAIENVLGGTGTNSVASSFVVQDSAAV